MVTETVNLTFWTISGQMLRAIAHFIFGIGQKAEYFSWYVVVASTSVNQYPLTDNHTAM